MKNNIPDVYVTGEKPYGTDVSVYRVLVDGKVYDEMTSKTILTRAEMFDIAAGYQEALAAVSS